MLVVVDMSSLNFRRRRRIEGRSEFDRLTSDEDVFAATVVDCDDFMGLSPSASRFADLIRSPPSFVVAVDFPATAAVAAGSTSSFLILLVGLVDGF